MYDLFYVTRKLFYIEVMIMIMNNMISNSKRKQQIKHAGPCELGVEISLKNRSGILQVNIQNHKLR